jgi:YVTN family beta-propeller protein
MSSLVLAPLAFLFALALAGCDSGGDSGSDSASDDRVGSQDRATSEATPPGNVRLYAVDRYEGVRRLDPNTLEVIDSIDSGPRPHGIVASADGRTLYITLEVSNEVIKVDVATHEVLARASVGEVPNEPTLSADGRYLFVPLRAAGGTDIVDTETMTRVKTLDSGAGSHNAYTAPDGGLVYSTSMGDDQIAVIDPATLELVRIIPLSGQPRPVALTADGRLAHVVLSGMTGFITVDLSTDQEVARMSVPIPEGTPAPPLDTYTHGLLLTPDEREIWVAAYATDKVYGYLMPERGKLAEISVPGGPHWLTLNPEGEPLYVSLERSGQVAAIHRGLREVIRVAKVGRAPTRILAFRTPVP